MPQLIETDGTLDWVKFEVVLDGAEYTLELAWNTRDERWYLGISKADGTALLTGTAIVVDYPLLRRCAGPDIPKGYLMAIDTTDNGEELTVKEDLGVRVQLVYFSEAEIDEVFA